MSSLGDKAISRDTFAECCKRSEHLVGHVGCVVYEIRVSHRAHYLSAVGDQESNGACWFSCVAGLVLNVLTFL